jgi:hypothetical protein
MIQRSVPGPMMPDPAALPLAPLESNSSRITRLELIAPMGCTPVVGRTMGWEAA